MGLFNNSYLSIHISGIYHSASITALCKTSNTIREKRKRKKRVKIQVNFEPYRHMFIMIVFTFHHISKSSIEKNQIEK